MHHSPRTVEELGSGKIAKVLLSYVFMILINSFRRNYSQRIIDIDLTGTNNSSSLVIRDYSVPAKLKCGLDWPWTPEKRKNLEPQGHAIQSHGYLVYI